MKTKEKSDKELITLVRGGDREAEEQLLKRYSPMVKKEARFLFLVGAEDDDLLQEGMIGLVKAIRGYQEEKDTAFSTYAVICIRGQLKTAVTAALRKKHIPLNSYISIDSDEEEDRGALQFHSEENSIDPEEFVMKQEQVNEMLQKLEEVLSSFEKEVVRLYLDGLSCADIGKQLGKNEKSIQNAISRIRQKLK